MTATITFGRDTTIAKEGAMNYLAKTLRYRRGLPAIMALALTACATCGLDSKLGLIRPGMKINQVEALLGSPTRIDETQTANSTTPNEVYHYSTPAGDGRVVFVNGIVFSSTLLTGSNS